MPDESHTVPNQYQDDIAALIHSLKIARRQVPPDEAVLTQIKEEIARRALVSDTRLQKRARRELGGNADLAHDAAVEAVMRVLERPEKFDETRSGLAWIAGYMKYTIIEIKKKILRTSIIQPSLEDDHLKVPCNQRHDNAQIDLEGILLKLNETQRRVIELTLKGLSGVEIGAELGLSTANVKVIKHRALEKLKALLAKDIAA